MLSPKPVRPLYNQFWGKVVLIYLLGNDAIENQLKRDRQLAKNEIKMLLLGAGESGKSTVLKQMKLIHHGSYSNPERESFKEIVYSNTVQSMRAILEALPQLGISLRADNESRYRIVMGLGVQGTVEGDRMPSAIADAVIGLYADPAIKEAVSRSR